MKVLVLGNGGREHAICWKLAQSQVVSEVFSWPFNPIIARFAPPLCDPKSNISNEELLARVKERRLDFVVVGPEAPLAAGIVDLADRLGIKVFGPRQAAAQLESSKRFAKELMQAAGVPTAGFAVAGSRSACQRLAEERLGAQGGVVLKASGLAGGKGVFVCLDQQQVSAALEHLYGESMKAASQEVVVEELLTGRECSFFVLVGQGVSPLGFAVDFKRLHNNDDGPNTGGMGCYSPVPWLPTDAQDQVMQQVVRPIVAALKERQIPYSGFLYVGLMWTADGPKVIEFNVRLGDPEAQVLALQDATDWGQTIAYHLGLQPEPSAPAATNQQRRSVCVVMTSSDYPFGQEQLPRHLLDDAVFAEGDTTVFAAAVTATDEGQIRRGRGRVLAVAGAAASFGDARTKVYSRVEAVKRLWPDCHFRTDIALKAMQEEQS